MAGLRHANGKRLQGRPGILDRAAMSVSDSAGYESNVWDWRVVIEGYNILTRHWFGGAIELVGRYAWRRGCRRTRSSRRCELRWISGEWIRLVLSRHWHRENGEGKN